MLLYIVYCNPLPAEKCFADSHSSVLAVREVLFVDVFLTLYIKSFLHNQTVGKLTPGIIVCYCPELIMDGVEVCKSQLLSAPVKK